MGLIPAGITSGEANRIRQNCYAKVLEWGMHIPVGLFLQDLDTPAAAHGMHAEKSRSNHLQNAIDAAIKHSCGRSLTDIESCYGDLRIDVYRCATGDDNDQ